MDIIRDVDDHVICFADSDRGLIEHSIRKEMIRISLPVGGEVLFIKDGCYTVIRRNSSRGMYVFSDHHTGMDYTSRQ